MSTVFQSNISIIIIVLPIILTILLYQLMIFFTKQKWRAIHFTVQWTAVFYALAVAILIGALIEQVIIGYIFIGILLLLSSIIVLQWKKKHEVLLVDALKIAMRVVFLLFGLIYIILLLYLLVEVFVLN